jgi:hypothetical protein
MKNGCTGVSRSRYRDHVRIGKGVIKARLLSEAEIAEFVSAVRKAKRKREMGLRRPALTLICTSTPADAGGC